jgi:hypothetical protein
MCNYVYIILELPIVGVFPITFWCLIFFYFGIYLFKQKSAASTVLFTLLS